MNTISHASDHPTIAYAASELDRCLQRLTDADFHIRLGLISELPGITAPEVADPEFDDAIHIDVTGGTGVIAGINPRSVLLGVYRYLIELGCRWVRPGADGEYIPRLDSLPDVSIAETASYRHRGVCIEGAVSEEHVRDMIEWMPRVGFNGYFIQFREAYTFFNRWYAHERNDLLGRESISLERARELTAHTVDEIKKRDLLYHAVGHGWTCEPFGIGGLGWDRNDEELPESVTRYLAQVSGERKLWGGIALNTNLCYGNPEVRRILTEDIANYAEAHPEVDILHFWLADGSNNQCECELCRDTRPADFYVMMLNELDKLMTENGLRTRVVFLIYVDLLWPPRTQRIENPDRFILMFAPITRTYSRSFAVGEHVPELPPFELNKLSFPSSVDENVAFLKAWQHDFAGDSFDFDYHMMWDHHKDFGYTAISRVLSEDVKGLRDIGINGYVSCQVQRAFLPTGLPMTVMGWSLWRSDLDYDRIADDYFAAAFGPDGAKARSYLERISTLMDPVYVRGEKPAVDKHSAEQFARIPALLDDFAPTVQHNLALENVCWAKSWSYLAYHAQMCRMFAAALEARARGNQSVAADRWEELRNYVWREEMQIHPVLDVFEFVTVLSGLFTR